VIDDQRPPRLSVQGFEPFHWGDTPAMRRTLPDGRQVGVVPMLFIWAVIVTTGDLTNPLDGYDDRWCYRGLASAIEAAWQWDGTGEPTGWIRHPISGRRRDNGDPATEYVQP
jgi:hypothetical protein